MSDDFGTVNVSRAERARELDVMRQHYHRHRQMLNKLVADAPTEALAAEYRQIIQEIDASLVKLDELGDPLRLKTEPGMRPLVTPAPAEESIGYDEPQSDSRSRLALIFFAALVALTLIGWMIWKASSDRKEPGSIVEPPSTAAPPTTIAEDAPPVAPARAPVEVLRVTPRAADYGIIRKGTRATRQFEVTNDSEQPVTIQVARSACRCLFYEYAELIPPKSKETITVTVDGARVAVGPLRESVRVSAKSDPRVATSFDAIATIR